MDDGEQLRPPGRHGGPGERKQRSPHPVEAETDRREDSPGDRRSAAPDRSRDLRNLPRLRRADCRSAPDRHSLDAGLHQLQGKAGIRVHKDELRQLLTDCAAERLSILQRHEAGARVVSHYDFNNTYQYVIAREDTHLSWVGQALVEMDTPLPKASSTLAVPPLAKTGKTLDVGAFQPVLSDDARLLGAFVEKWRAKVEALTHARHKTMLNVVLGETREHQRLFEQAADGNEDVLGRRTGGAAREGAVLPARWQE